MKKAVSLLAILFALSTASFAQNEKDEKNIHAEKRELKKHTTVPSAVKSSFTKDFPGASAKWDKEDANYEANFKKDGKTMSALYDSNGNTLETEVDIKVSELPQPVKEYIAQNYKGQKIKEAAMITRANGEVNYEAEVKNMDVLFTKDGKFIKTIKD